MCVYFKDEIKKNNCSKKKRMRKINKYTEKFKGIGWLKVKTFIYNQSKLD